MSVAKKGIRIVLLKAFPLKTPPALKLDVDQYKQEVNYVPFNSSENGPVSFAKYLPPKVVGVEAEIPQGLNGSCAEEDGKEIFDSRYDQSSACSSKIEPNQVSAIFAACRSGF